MAKDKPMKHTVIVDADLHIQNPEEIILSYFNTKNDNQFIAGKRNSFRNKLIMVFGIMVFMKMFFQELFTGFFNFVITMVVVLILGFIFAEGVIFFSGLLNRSAKSDSVRGLAFSFVLLTIIVIMLGLFI